MRDLLSRVAELPPHTIVLYSTLFEDGEGAPFVPHDVAEHLAAASNAPVYGFNDQYLGRGIVGGRMYTLNAHGETAAGLVLKVLAGIPPSNIPVVEPEASVTQFDWRQLQRWGIRESHLPQGSTVLFRQLSFWDKYKLYVVAVAAILTLQAVIIGGLLLQRKRRRRAEDALRASEEWLRLGQQIARIGSFEWNIRTGVNTWTPELEAKSLVSARRWKLISRVMTCLQPLPTDVSLSLFRVLQEALRNAAKHSGVKRFEVRLWGSTGEIHLTVSDLGAGFDTETAMKSTGLGLTSMQERLRLVHGELSINSQLKGGTTIHARVPFGSGADSVRAAG